MFQICEMLECSDLSFQVVFIIHAEEERCSCTLDDRLPAFTERSLKTPAAQQTTPGSFTHITFGPLILTTTATKKTFHNINQNDNNYWFA